MAGPLQGVRIIDLTTMLMGPSATQLLGDLGAEVFKIETPEGDPMRNVGPMRNPAMGPLYLNANRNKRSVVLDLQREGDRATLLQLIGTVDVFISNIRSASLKRLGLAWDDIRAIDPRIIYCCAEGFGADGPYSGRAAYDDMIQALSGISGLFKEAEGEPMLQPLNLCDRISGLCLANAVLAALYERERSGEGQAIELPMFETLAQFVLADHLGGHTFSPPLGPPGYARLLSRERKPFQTLDGHLCAAIYTDDHWRRFLHFVGEKSLIDSDANFASIDARMRLFPLCPVRSMLTASSALNSSAVNSFPK